MNRFENKNILITGAASGIGLATAIKVAKEGGNLALLDINEEALIETVASIKSYNSNIIYLTCDLSDFTQTQATIDKLIAEVDSLQGLAHCAGIARCYNTHEMSLANWQELININLTGSFNVIRHALPYLLDNENSYLVNVSSIAADYRHPWMSAYAATKGAIKSFTRSLFVEYCLHGLHANCVLPGSIDTPLARNFTIPAGANKELLKTLVPLGKSKLVSADYAANVVAFLLSDDAYHINGTEISVDGGKIL